MTNSIRQEVKNRFERAADHSDSIQWCRSMGARTNTALQRSRTAAALAPLGKWIGGSRLHQWFLRPPEPRVVRINLGDSLLLRPILRAVLKVTRADGPFNEGSRINHIWRAFAEWYTLRRFAWAWLVLFVLATAVTSRQSPPSETGIRLIVAGIALVGLQLYSVTIRRDELETGTSTSNGPNDAQR